MPVLNKRPPKLCVKKSRGTAFVCFNGKEIYMGKVGPEADKNYRIFISSWANSSLGSIRPNKNEEITLELLLSEYLLYIRSVPNYAKSEEIRAKSVIQRILQLFPDMNVDRFGPLELEAVRNSFMKSGYSRHGEERCYSRKYLNRLVNVIRSIFKWGVSKTLVKPDTHQRLLYVQALQRDHSVAPETMPRVNIEDNEIDKTLPYMQNLYRDMIRLMRQTGMRPSEVCRMRSCDIDQTRSDGIWLYVPYRHKTQGKGKKRIIPLGRKAQKILKDRIVSKDKCEYLFTPKEARSEQWTERRVNRKSKITPSQKEREKKVQDKKYKKLNDHISPASISRSVSRAIDRAEKEGVHIVRWSPYSIRHQVITDIAEKEGPIASQRLAGHSTLNTTEIYDHSALSELIKLAKKYG